MRGRCERQGKRRGLRGDALCLGAARRGRDHDAGLEKRDVTPGVAAWSWRRRDGLEEEDEEEGYDGDDKHQARGAKYEECVEQTGG